MNGVLHLERRIGQIGADLWEEQSTKTHSDRRVVLDPETAALMVEHRQRCVARARALGAELSPDAFVFSLDPDGTTPRRPESVTQRYRRMCKRIGVRTTIHKLRHYAATELILAGVDIRTVAGRLGHAGGGATTFADLRGLGVGGGSTRSQGNRDTYAVAGWAPSADR